MFLKKFTTKENIMKQRNLFLIIFCIVSLFAPYLTVSAANQLQDNTELIPVTTTFSSLLPPVTTTCTVVEGPLSSLPTEVLGYIGTFLQAGGRKTFKLTSMKCSEAMYSIIEKLNFDLFLSEAAIFYPTTGKYIDDNVYISKGYIDRLIRRCHSVKELSCRRFTNEQLQWVIDARKEEAEKSRDASKKVLLCDIDSFSDALTTVTFSGKRFDSSTISDKELVCFLQTCPKLTELRLYKCDSITDTGLREIAQYSPELKTLSLYECKNITGGVGLREIAQCYLQLRSLDISYCCGMTDNGFQEIAQGCPELRVLNLSNCRQITDTGLRGFAQYCSKLIELNLTDCNQITDDVLKEIAQSCKELKTIRLVGCLLITDVGLECLAQGCPKLTVLTLGCDKITDKGLRTFVQRSPQLEFLFLRNSWQITDETITEIKKIYPKLTIER